MTTNQESSISKAEMLSAFENAPSESNLTQNFDPNKASIALMQNVHIASFVQTSVTDIAYSASIYSPEKLDDFDLSAAVNAFGNLGFTIESTANRNIQHPAGNLHFHQYKLVQKTNIAELTVNVTQLSNYFEFLLNKKITNDILSYLIHYEGIKEKHINVIRAYCKYLVQISSHSYYSLINGIAKESVILNKIMMAFVQKFNPELSETERGKHETMISDLQKEIIAKKLPTSTTNTLQSLLNLLIATIRTNFFVKHESRPRDIKFISLKFKSSLITEMPKPVPFAEIFVYSEDFEAIHLRGGKIARGGIRWSDRQDYRVEVLGLMKTQVVKNTIIVPTGAKGGFFIKSKNKALDYAIDCYKCFLSGILDITDNVIDGQISTNEMIVKYDENDPYLVVAADKGTATFSDFANAISEKYNFWLKDAFASGGSNGYDHKKIGITARGAWEGVKRHLLELGKKAEDPISTIAIGSMNGDVFGNGLLYSEKIQLIAAFNHEYIFIDPYPDMEKSYTERVRLFKAAEASWAKYDPKAISGGGGVFARFGEDVSVSKEMKEVLDLPEALQTISPNELIKYILRARVDLFWNGGIGTFVKSSSEGNDQVKDSFNDPVRINGSDLRALCVGEGGNLGFTQLGRIEYALLGGRLNTDAIDNSGGVDCSDHEVNIKILLNQIQENGYITTSERNSILAEMTTEISDLVLHNNYLQTQAISIAKQMDGLSYRMRIKALLNHLTKSGILDAKLEYIPDSGEITRRDAANIGFTRPEMAIIISYSKIMLHKTIIKSEIFSDKIAQQYLYEYFPSTLQKAYSANISKHQLKKEIITVTIVNEIVNRLGPAAMNDIINITGADMETVVRAYLMVIDIFKIKDIWRSIDLMNTANISIKYRLHINIAQFIERLICRLVMLYGSDIIKDGDNHSKLSQAKNLLQQSSAEKNYALKFTDISRQYQNLGLAEDLARIMASIECFKPILTVVYVSVNSHQSIEIAEYFYGAVDQMLDSVHSKATLDFAQADEYWEQISALNAIHQIINYQSIIAAHIIQQVDISKINSIDDAIECIKQKYTSPLFVDSLNFCINVKRLTDKNSTVLHLILHRMTLIYEAIMQES